MDITIFLCQIDFAKDVYTVYFVFAWLKFLRRMAQPYDKAGSGAKKTLLTQEDMERIPHDAMDLF